ncbi:hypothetical protein RSK20926_02619 [Roseobacter sp. SK209-2-6]|uniref:hypothetical protein n=1 Tax=Roseobacter sp. SK209-2-6 TaxID=388739 RepID=UPI0000F3ED74|nr:hypothetical protein [Roseobacter sp. SK209-2-6]EBA16662.1 hypothetical protein RSK20926_02619 [Roseobacter sp. SK209-2-6]
MAGLLPAISLAGSAANGQTALKDFGRRLYVLGETTGGSLEDWQAAEQKLLEDWRSLQ